MVYVDDAGSYKGAHEALVAYFGCAIIGSKIRESEGFYEAVWWKKQKRGPFDAQRRLPLDKYDRGLG